MMSSMKDIMMRSKNSREGTNQESATDTSANNEEDEEYAQLKLKY